MKIYDAFMFFNEDDLLAMRLQYLGPVVDKFIIVEGAQTFSGKQHKPRFLKLREMLPEAMQEKINYVQVSFPIGMNDPWEREAFQRNAIIRGLPQDAEPNDLLMVSDCDEIPRYHYVSPHIERPAVFQQELYFYTPHWRHVDPWYGTRVRRIDWFLEEGGTPQQLRSTLRPLPGERIIESGGWSFSYFGGVDAIQEKVKAYSHTEVNKPEFINREHIEDSIQRGLPLVRGDGNYLEYVEDPQVPEFMRVWGETFGLKAGSNA